MAIRPLLGLTTFASKDSSSETDISGAASLRSFMETPTVSDPAGPGHDVGIGSERSGRSESCRHAADRT